MRPWQMTAVPLAIFQWYLGIKHLGTSVDIDFKYISTFWLQVTKDLCNSVV